MDADDLRFYALYLAFFANALGFVTLITLLPTYIDLYDPSGLVIGLFTTGLMVARGVGVIPVAWTGDRSDKRRVLLASLGLGALVYAGFTLVSSSLTFVGMRALQGLSLSGAGLMTLGLVGERSPDGASANYIGKANAARFAGSIGGALAAGALYEYGGFEAAYAPLVAVLLVALVGVWLFVEPDETRVPGNPFADLAFNRRILTLTSFRAQYAVAVTLVRTWVPIFAGVAAASGGLAMSGTAVGLVVAAEKFTNMLAQPHTGRFSDSFARAPFVVLGGGAYGLVALAVPFTPAVGEALGVGIALPVLGTAPPSLLPLLGLNALLGIADSMREPASMALFADEGIETKGGGVASSFGIRNLVWQPGSILAPMLGGVLMTDVGMAWVFYVGAAAAFTGVASFLAVHSRWFGLRTLTHW